MADVREWLQKRLTEALPRADLSPGDVGRSVQDLAEATAALERGGGTAFGMHLGAEDHERCSALAGEFRKGLEKWKAFLIEQFGDEGSTFVDDIVSRYDIRLGPPPSLRCEPLGSAALLDENAKNAVEQLASALAEPSALTAIWKKEDQLLDDDESVWLGIGEPDEEALRALAEDYERTFNRAFPVLLAHLLSRFNGFAIAPEEEAGSSETLPADELVEPACWPAKAYGDHFLLFDVGILDDAELFVVGELADSGYLCLAVAHEQQGDGLDPAGPPIFWVDRSFSSVKPRNLTRDTATFLVEWCAAGLSIPLLLRRHGVPGWG